MSATQ